MKKVLICILNFYQTNYVCDLLDDLYNKIDIKGIDFLVAIGDILPNTQEDKLIKKKIYEIKKNFNGKIEYFILKKNLGYAKGNNYIIKKCEYIFKPDYVLIINPDIRLTSENILQELIKTINDEIVCVGPKVILENGIQQGPYIKQTPLKYGLKKLFPFLWFPLKLITYYKNKRINQIQKVYRIIGAFMLIDYNFFNKIDFFDENTFLFWEEDILSEKIYSMNKKVVYVPYVNVLHLHNYENKKQNKMLDRCFNESMAYYFKLCGYNKKLINFALISKSIYDNIWNKMYIYLYKKLKKFFY